MEYQGRRLYPSDLTDSQWESIKLFIPNARVGGRPRTTDVRRVLEAIFYLNRTGCAWRFLPNDFPKWQTCYDYCRQWNKLGIFKDVCSFLGKQVRLNCGLNVFPATVIIDSQSVKAQFGENRGYDGFKKVRGRKRHILVDALGTVLEARVSAANLSDNREGIELIDKAKNVLSKRPIQSMYADGGYRTSFAYNMVSRFKIWPIMTSSTVRHKHHARELLASNLKPKRWIVERTFAWFNHYRRLVRDFERTTCQSETMIFIAMAQLLLRRLHPK